MWHYLAWAQLHQAVAVDGGQKQGSHSMLSPCRVSSWRRSWLRGSAWLLVQVLAFLNLPSHILQCTLHLGKRSANCTSATACWETSTSGPSPPSCSPHSSPSKAAGGLHRKLEEPHQLNGLGCSRRPWHLFLRKIKSLINYAAKAQGLIINTQQIQGPEHAMGKVQAQSFVACLGTASRDCTEQVTSNPFPSLALSHSPHPIQSFLFCHLLSVYYQLGHWFNSAADKFALALTVTYRGLLKQLAGISIHQLCPSSPSGSFSSSLGPNTRQRQGVQQCGAARDDLGKGVPHSAQTGARQKGNYRI